MQYGEYLPEDCTEIKVDNEIIGLLSYSLNHAICSLLIVHSLQLHVRRMFLSLISGVCNTDLIFLRVVNLALRCVDEK